MRIPLGIPEPGLDPRVLERRFANPSGMHLPLVRVQPAPFRLRDVAELGGV